MKLLQWYRHSSAQQLRCLLACLVFAGARWEAGRGPGITWSTVKFIKIYLFILTLKTLKKTSLALSIPLGLIVDKQWTYTAAFLQGFGDTEQRKVRKNWDVMVQDMNLHALGSLGRRLSKTDFHYFITPSSLYSLFVYRALLFHERLAFKREIPLPALSSLSPYWVSPVLWMTCKSFRPGTKHSEVFPYSILPL